jgi:hypothetical protein
MPNNDVDAPGGVHPIIQHRRCWFRPTSRSAVGHFDQFPSTSPGVGCPFGQETFAGATGNDGDAPKATVRHERNRRRRPTSVICGPTVIVPIDNLWWPVAITV